MMRLYSESDEQGTITIATSHNRDSKKGKHGVHALQYTPATGNKDEVQKEQRYLNATVIVLVALLGTYGQAAIGILPLMVTSWVEVYGFSESEAGSIGSLTLGGMTLGLASSILFLKHRPHARVATVGLWIAIAADIGSVIQHTPLSVGAIRFVAGIGYGLVVACVVSWFARQKMADRCFGTFMLLQLLVFALLLMGIPYLSAWLGQQTPYYCLIFLGVFCLFLTPLLNHFDSDSGTLAKALEPQGYFPPDVPLLISLSAVLAPGIVLVAAIGFWAFLQQFGLYIGIAEKQLGTIIGLITLSGIPGCIAVIWLGNRLGRLVPILVGLTALLIPIIMFWWGADSFGSYVIGGVIFTMAWSFSIPTIQAIQSDLDGTGQIAAISATPQAIGSAIGPAAFAMALAIGDYTFAFLVTAILILISVFVVIPPTLMSRYNQAKKM